MNVLVRMVKFYIMFILRFLEFGQKIIFSFSLQVFESVLYLGNPVIIFRQHRYRETMPLMNEIKLMKF